MHLKTFASICFNLCSSKNHEFGKASSGGEKRAELFACYCVCVSKDIFAWVHGDVMEKGRNAIATGLEKKRRNPSSPPLFTLFYYFMFVQKKKEP